MELKAFQHIKSITETFSVSLIQRLEIFSLHFLQLLLEGDPCDNQNVFFNFCASTPVPGVSMVWDFIRHKKWATFHTKKIPQCTFSRLLKKRKMLPSGHKTSGGTTSYQRLEVAAMLMRHYINVMCSLG